MPKNTETAKTTTGTVFAPTFLHASLVGAFGARASRKNGRKSCYNRYTATRKWPPGLQKAQTFSRPRIQQVYLIQEFFFNRTLAGPPVSTESTCGRLSLLTQGLVRHNAEKRACGPTPTMAPTHSTLFPLICPLRMPQRPRPFLLRNCPGVSPHASIPRNNSGLTTQNASDFSDSGDCGTPRTERCHIP